MVTYLITVEVPKSPEHIQKLQNNSKNPWAINLITGPCMKTIGKIVYNNKNQSGWLFNHLFEKKYYKTALLIAGVKKSGKFHVHLVKGHKIYKHQIKGTTSITLTEKDMCHLNKINRKKQIVGIYHNKAVQKKVHISNKYDEKKVRDIFEKDLTNIINNIFGIKR